jgi:hypothetical protein
MYRELPVEQDAAHPGHWPLGDSFAFEWDDSVHGRLFLRAPILETQAGILNWFRTAGQIRLVEFMPSVFNRDEWNSTGQTFLRAPKPLLIAAKEGITWQAHIGKLPPVKAALVTALYRSFRTSKRMDVCLMEEVMAILLDTPPDFVACLTAEQAVLLRECMDDLEFEEGPCSVE